MSEKALSHRKGCIQAVLCALGGEEPHYVGVLVDREVVGRKYLDDLEKVIRIGATDKDIEVRKMAKKVWDIYRSEWSIRVASYVNFSVLISIAAVLTLQEIDLPLRLLQSSDDT